MSRDSGIRVGGGSRISRSLDGLYNVLKVVNRQIRENTKATIELNRKYEEDLIEDVNSLPTQPKSTKQA